MAMRWLAGLTACGLLSPWLLCSAVPPGAAPTFTKDIAPIFYRSCVGCHHPNDIAPMSLVTYQTARPWAQAIKQAVVLRVMPPWHADPSFGHFANDPRLSEAEIARIRAWVDGGAKEGDPRDLPTAPTFAEGWKIGKPDAVIDIGEDHVVEASGEDEYLYFTVPTHFAEDRWVKAVELRPGNRRVVHHAHVWVDETPLSAHPAAARAGASSPQQKYTYKTGRVLHIVPDAPVVNDGCQVDDGGVWPGGQLTFGSGPLGSYLPGKTPDVYPAGTAKLVRAGANLKFQIHYSKTAGARQTDRTSVGLIFAAEPPARPLHRVDLSNYLFQLPAGAPNVEVRECHTMERDVLLLSYVAHMHYRGKDMKFEAIHPNGVRETLLLVPAYSFQWQTVYRVKKPVLIEKGTRLMLTAHFDNSVNNKWNPDPARTVRWGEPSTEEMMDGWFEYVEGREWGPAFTLRTRR